MKKMLRNVSYSNGGISSYSTGAQTLRGDPVEYEEILLR